METKLQSTDFHKKVKIPGDILPNSCIVDCIVSSSNRSGGLAMLWSNDVKLDIIAYNERVIDCYITCSNNNERWRASGIYGYSNHHQKHQTCDIINNLYQTDNHANWLLFGDFNIVLNHAEKLGGRDINISLTNSFQNTLNICSLQDLGYQGDTYTWSNNQETVHHIKERLDRFLANPSWISKFPRHVNYHLPNYTSDHNPILLVFGNYDDARSDSKSKNFIKRFEHVWLQDGQSFNIIKDVWNSSTADTNTKLQQAFDKVYQWGHDTYGNIPRQIKKIQQAIHNMKSKIPTKDEIEETHQLETNLDNLLKHEETWWAQRAKANWLQQGDKNSKFFHLKATQRKRKNRINFILNQ
jgi:hypothetical protein